ncbi:uncharacterized protein BDZ99DRAFT_300478 [Mytilinidion resinicola]|uniref:F-box domain-containing protein n=1 Tax=Mytilinidion resinicola TaxID=574789 RepID=A0A6A6YN36_9PEZI|nr:uncharacterized protein BDZ99DRAFT_300478 [Mytilinidion resinicola]KAF2809969.1 hypothetical protein BDZ99DRAFT_300478 [Mytilinidion resinicola]
MTGISDLATEILDLIFSFLTSKSDKLNTALVCKLFRDCAEPLFYHDYVHEGGWEKETAYSLTPFIRRIIERPDRAHFVKHVTLHKWNYDGQTRRPRAISDEDLSAFVEAARKAGILDPTKESDQLITDAGITDLIDPVDGDWEDFSEPSQAYGDTTSGHDDAEWIQQLQVGNEEPQIILLLAILPGIKSLSFTGIPRQETLSWSQLRQVAHGFRHLRNISCTADNIGYSASLSRIGHLMGAPSLQKVFLSDGGRTGRDISNQNITSVELTPLPVKVATFEHSDANFRTLSLFVSKCTGLEYLTLKVTNPFLRARQINATQLKNIINTQSDSLKGLRLCLDMSRGPLELEHTRLESLSHFKNLVFLEAEQVLLLGRFLQVPQYKLRDILPSSLKGLSIGWAEENLMPHLLELASVCDMDFGSLELLCVSFASNPTRTKPTVSLPLAFDASRVKVIVETNRRWPVDRSPDLEAWLSKKIPEL